MCLNILDNKKGAEAPFYLNITKTLLTIALGLVNDFVSFNPRHHAT